MRSLFSTQTRSLPRRLRATRDRRMSLEYLEGRELLTGVTISIADVSVREGPASLGALDPAGAVAVGLTAPRNMVFDNTPGHPHYHDLFVASSTTNSVVRFDWATQTYQPFVTDGPLLGARDVIVGPDGNLYVSALKEPEVLRYDGTDGHFLDAYVAPNAGGLSTPCGMAFGSDGNFYVSSMDTGQILKYQGLSTGPNGEQPGQYLGVFATTGDSGSSPSELTFGPDGNLYVACPQFGTPTEYDGVVNRYQGPSGSSPGQFIDTFVPTGRGGLMTPRSPVFDAQGHLYVNDGDLDEVLRYQGPNEPNPGAFIDAFVTSGQGQLTTQIGLALGPDGNFYATDRDTNQVARFAPTSQARFVVTLNSASTSQVSVNYATANGTATAAGDYTQTTGTMVFAPGETMKTITVPIVDDLVGEPTESFQVNLSNAVNASIADNKGVGTILDNETKFYVAEATTARTYEYGSGGTSEEITLHGGINTNTAPRGVAATAAGTTVWVVDSNKRVYIYNNGGALLGSWSAGSLASNATVEGIATNSTDVWIVDAQQDKVFRYTNAAGRLSGSQNAVSSFSLNNKNTNPKDIVTDGVNLWVVDDASTDKVFKYNLSGTLLGSWSITGAGSSPTGITLDPTGGTALWIVDSGTDRVYQFDNARGLTSGSLSPSTIFALAAGNTNPQGIADPPAGRLLPVAASRHAATPRPAVKDSRATQGHALFALAPDQDRTSSADRPTPAGPRGLRHHRNPAMRPISDHSGVELDPRARAIRG